MVHIILISWHEGNYRSACWSLNLSSTKLSVFFLSLFPWSFKINIHSDRSSSSSSMKFWTYWSIQEFSSGLSLMPQFSLVITFPWNFWLPFLYWILICSIFIFVFSFVIRTFWVSWIMTILTTFGAPTFKMFPMGC